MAFRAFEGRDASIKAARGLPEERLPDLGVSARRAARNTHYVLRKASGRAVQTDPLPKGAVVPTVCKCELTAGTIGLQSEGAETLWKNIRIRRR